MSDVISKTIEQLSKRVNILEGESEVRRVQARYMFLCDTPIPEVGVSDDQDRIDLVMELFAKDAIWEGVGEYYSDQFGCLEGAEQIRQHFNRFWGQKQDPALLLNCHYLTSEQIHIAEDGQTAEAQWVHMQPWLFSDGKALLRSSRLNNAFRKCEDGTWRYTRLRTENVFIAPLPSTWASDYPSDSVLMNV